MDQEHLNTKDLKHHAVATIPGVQRVSFKKKYQNDNILLVPNTPRDEFGEFDRPNTPGTPSYPADDYQGGAESPAYRPQTPSYESTTPFPNPTPSPSGSYRPTPSPGYPGPTPVSKLNNKLDRNICVVARWIQSNSITRWLQPFTISKWGSIHATLFTNGNAISGYVWKVSRTL